MDFNYIDIDKKLMSTDIELIFPEWKIGKERVCVFSPHDDDALIGAGYAVAASIANNAEVYIFIFCRGNAGYSSPEQKDEIKIIRAGETANAYIKLGVKEENITRFNESDFSAIQNIGWYLKNNTLGSFKKILAALRKHKITRLLIPNRYKEHIDHTAVNIMGTYYSPQAGDPIVVDWGEPHSICSVLEYSVWTDLSPEDMLVSSRARGLRANRIVTVPEDVEERICGCISEYRSQGEIIRGLVEARSERRCKNGRYLEIYLSFDPRPKLDYGPYREFIDNTWREESIDV